MTSNHDNTNKKKQKGFFLPYLQKDVAETLLASGHLIQGNIRINQKNYQEAFLAHPNGDADVFLDFKSRNRSLQNDIVAVQIQSRNRWKVLPPFIELVERHLRSKGASDAQITAKMLELRKKSAQGGLTDLAALNAVFPNCMRLLLKPLCAPEMTQHAAEMTQHAANATADKDGSNGDVGNDVISKLSSCKIGAMSDCSIGEEWQFDLESNADLESNFLAHWWSFVQRTGRVVCILHEIHPRVCVAVVAQLNNTQSNVQSNTQQTSQQTSQQKLQHKKQSKRKDWKRFKMPSNKIIDNNVDETPNGNSGDDADDTNTTNDDATGNTSAVVIGWENAKFVCFSPLDSRVPRIRVHNLGVQEKRALLQTALAQSGTPPSSSAQPLNSECNFAIRITKWSEFQQMPDGEIMECLENANVVEAVTRNILMENDIIDEPFSRAVQEELQSRLTTHIDPKSGELRTDQLETSGCASGSSRRRRDLRDPQTYAVITIDPKSARDLDDALHVRRLAPIRSEPITSGEAEAVWEVGVHIADVSYFVEEHNELDAEAARRATTTYLVQRAIPMLPGALCEQYFSLNPGRTRFAFSVIYRLDAHAQILNTWFGRTIIKSCARLSYEDAQMILDNAAKTSSSSANSMHDFLPPIASSQSPQQVVESVLQLNELARLMRQRRLRNGSLRLNLPKLQFTFPSPAASPADQHSTDSSSSTPISPSSCGSSYPTGYNLEVTSEANRLVEEWMLRANMSVAELLCEHLPGLAFLRRHPAPSGKNLANLSKYVRVATGKSEARHVEGDKEGEEEEDLQMMSSLQMQRRIISLLKLHTKQRRRTQHAQLDGELDKQLKKDGEEEDDDEEAEFEESDLDAIGLLTMNATTKAMQQATYFCLGAQQTRQLELRMLQQHTHAHAHPVAHHFGLNVPLYTHFTSPIRRYADVIVHRQVARILDAQAAGNGGGNAAGNVVGESAEALHRQAIICNTRKMNAKLASYQSRELFFAMFVHNSGGSAGIPDHGAVISLLDKCFEVFLLSCAIVLRIHANQCKGLSSLQYSKSEETLTFLWSQSESCKSKGHPEIPPTVVRSFETVPLILTAQIAQKGPKINLQGRLRRNSCALCENEPLD